MKTPVFDSEDYVRMAGRHCPACGEFGQIDIESMIQKAPGMIHQPCVCNGCGASWTEVWQLFSYINLEDGDTKYQVTEPEAVTLVDGDEFRQPETKSKPLVVESSLTGDYEDPRGPEYGIITITKRPDYKEGHCIHHPTSHWNVQTAIDEDTRNFVIAHCGPSLPTAEVLAQFGKVSIVKRGFQFWIMQGNDVCYVSNKVKTLGETETEFCTRLGEILVEIEAARKEGK